MSLSFGSSKKKTSSSSQAEPWAPIIPSLMEYAGDVNSAKQVLGPTGDQLDAFAALKAKAAAGNPWMTDINSVVNDTLGVTSRSPTVDDAYSRLQSQLGDVASGANQDILSDPRMQAMLQTVGDDVQNRITGMFAGAGRDITGNAAGQQAIGKGVTAAQLPILINEFGRQQGRTDAAIRDLFGGGNTAATNAQGLDRDALGTRAGGIALTNEALAARDMPENNILNLDQQLKTMPFEDLSLYASLMLPLAGLGQQQTGNSTTKGSSFGAGLNLLSDERAKEDITQIGETEDGQKIYRYRYVGSPEYHIGLLAQEVEKKHPEAVGQTKGGLKTVDYFAATEEAARKGGRY